MRVFRYLNVMMTLSLSKTGSHVDVEIDSESNVSQGLLWSCGNRLRFQTDSLCSRASVRSMRVSMDMSGSKSTFEP